jgi:membrane protein required for beta-lactamase induction
VAGKPDSPSRPPKVTGSRSGEIVVELPESPELGRYAAAALVFGASASVLVVEVVALRLLAPYLGLTLETSTLVIGVALVPSPWGRGPVDVSLTSCLRAARSVHCLRCPV